MGQLSLRAGDDDNALEIFPSRRNPTETWYIILEARGSGGRRALNLSPRQLKEVIQVAHINVGSVAPLGALVGTEVLR